MSAQRRSAARPFRRSSAQSLRRAVLLLFAAPGILVAQARGPTMVRVHVTDTTGAPVPAADLAVVRNGNETVLISRTDSSGGMEFTFHVDAARYTVMARKIGFAQQTDTLRATAGDTVSLEFTLLGSTTTLATVRTTARPLSKYKQPFVGAAEIAGEKRLLLSLGDVIAVLRPDIAYQSHRCVAGELLHPLVPGPIPRSHRFTKPPRNVRVYVNGEYFPGDADPWNSIYADHIAEIHYVNCNDNSIPGLPPEPWPSLYVVLKPVYGWDTKYGSFKVP